MSVTGKVLVGVGGTVITAGIIYWWLREHPLVPTCEDITTESECRQASCYWYEDKCHSFPQPPPDMHYECVRDPVFNLIMCGLVEGTGDSSCDPFASPEHCWDKLSCISDDECGLGAKCWKNKCYWTATPPHVQNLDWDGTHVEKIRFDFEERIIGNKVMGEVVFTLDPWNVGCGAHLRIYLIRNGQRVKRIYDKTHEDLAWTTGDPFTRPDPIVVFFPAEAVDGIEFWCRCERGAPWWSHSLVLTGVHCQFMYI